jgi:pilus assembly protein CpaF
MENVSLKFGPIDPYLRDDSVSEVMVNRFDKVFVERAGRLQESPAKFPSEAALLELIVSIARASGRDLDPSRPYMDSYLPDGSRVNATLPPMAPKGCTLTIRKFRKAPFGMDDYLQSGALSHKAAHYLHAAVIARLNIVVSGGTGTGKTTFLNALSGLVPQTERIITIEDVAELNLQHSNWVRLESVILPGKTAVTTRDCLVNALRMRPDRIIVGECRKDETFEMLQAMNTGHDGSMTTVHANSTRDCLARLESLILTSQVEVPLAALRRQMASAIHLVVQLKRTQKGQRVVQEIVEITGMEQNTITTQVLFTRERKAVNQLAGPASNLDNDGLLATGLPSIFTQRFSDAGIQFPSNFFDPNTKVTYQPD